MNTRLRFALQYVGTLTEDFQSAYASAYPTEPPLPRAQAQLVLSQALAEAALAEAWSESELWRSTHSQADADGDEG